MRVCRLGGFLLAALCAGVSVPPAQAQRSARQRVVIEVLPVTRLHMPQAPVRLGFDRAKDEGATDHSTFYELSTNVPDVKIAAALDAAMPDGTELLIEIESDLGKSVGAVSLSDAVDGRDVVTHIAQGGSRRQRITYTLQADPTAPDLDADTRTVTFTLTE